MRKIRLRCSFKKHWWNLMMPHLSDHYSFGPISVKSKVKWKLLELCKLFYNSAANLFKKCSKLQVLLIFFWNIILVSGWVHLDGRINLHANCWVSSFSDLYPIQSSPHKETSTEFDYPVFLSIFFGSTRSIYNFSPCSSINF